MPKNLIRVSLMIRKEQHDLLQNMNINISGYIRDLIDDRINDETIVLSVDSDTKKLYDQVISHSGQYDVEFEPYLKDALRHMLSAKIKKMEELHRSIAD